MYNINDCILVRTTDIFPESGVIKTPLNAKACLLSDSNYLGPLLRKKLKSMDKEYSHEYDILYEWMRSTIHFTINGLVANSLYGHFDYPLIILEPLKHHINEKSLLGLRVEDTYFNGDIVLSEDSIIMIEESYFERIKNEVDLSKYRIRLYSGKREDALEATLEELGYPYFRVCDHGYSDGLNPETKAYDMFCFIRDFANSNGISQERHFYSEIIYIDHAKSLESIEKYSRKHLIYILDSGLVDIELAEKIKMLLDSQEDEELTPLLEKLVDDIDLDKLKDLTKEFNSIEKAKIEGKDPKTYG